MNHSGIIIIYRVLQAFAGLLTLILIGKYLNHTEQGYYYTLGSLISLIWIFDLGLSQVAVNILSKDFKKLKWVKSNLEGNNPTYFSSLKKIFIFYLKVSLLFFLVSPLFIHFVKVDEYYSFKDIFILTIVLSLTISINFAFLPIYFLLESTKRISHAYVMRICYSLLTLIIFYTLLRNNLLLWIVVSSQISQLIIIIFFLKNYQKLIKKIFYSESKKRLTPNNLLIKSFPTYLSGFVLNIFSVPVIHNIFGSEISGKYGMSMVIINLIGLISMSFHQYRIPEMTRYANMGNKFIVDNIFKTSIYTFISCYVIFILIFIIVVFNSDLITNLFNFDISQKILSLIDFVKLTLIILILHFAYFFNSYTRLFLKDIFYKNYFLFLLGLILVIILSEKILTIYLTNFLMIALFLFVLNLFKFIFNRSQILDLN